MAGSLRAVVSRPSIEGDVPVVSVSPAKRKRPSWVLGGVVLVLVTALLGAYVFTAVSSKMSVMVAAHDLEPGVAISAADLRVVELGKSGSFRAIQPTQQDLILGEVPRALVPAGTVLNTGLFVSSSDAVPAGKAVVGAALAAGEIPVSNLRSGDTVSLLEVAAPNAAGVDPSARTGLVLGAAVVWAVTGSADPGASTSRVWVSLLVDVGLQAGVAQAAAGGRLRVGLVGS